MAPESIDSYTEAAAPYYEGVPSSETSSSAKDGDSEPGRRSTAVWRGPDLTGQFPDDAPSLSEALSLDDALSLDEPLFPDDDLYDFESLDAEEPTPSGAALQARHVEVDEAHLMGSFGFDDGLGEVPDDLVASEIPPTDEATSDAPAPTADDEAWEEEMIWEVVSPSR